MPNDQGDATFLESIAIFATHDGEFLAGALFEKCFGQGFPVPRDRSGLTIATPASGWSQYVALYRWPSGLFETVGFCNWIKHGEVYLEGGMCVEASFYRRLSRPHWKQCKSSGGVAQLLMQRAAEQLTDCVAWFGYCGDKKAMAVDKRLGYVATKHPYVIVKWFRTLSKRDEEALIEEIAKLGQF